jgi:hypothetical protein
VESGNLARIKIFFTRVLRITAGFRAGRVWLRAGGKLETAFSGDGIFLAENVI